MLKFKVARRSLGKALDILEPIVDVKARNEVLKAIRLVAERRKLNLTAKNRSISLSIDIPAEVTKEGSACFSADFLARCVKSAEESEMAVACGKDLRANVSCGSFKGNFAALAADGFPKSPDCSQTLFSAVNASKLKDALERIVSAHSSLEKDYVYDCDDFKPEAICLMAEEAEGEEPRVNLYSTDGVQFFSASMRVKEPLFAPVDSAMLLPEEGLRTLAALCDQSKVVRLGLLKKSLIAQSDKFSLSIGLLKGDYPDCKKILPMGSDIKFSINRKSLMAFVEKFKNMYGPMYSGESSLFNLKPGSLTIDCSSVVGLSF
jgi:DNA polymerase III sliding clamp (beta) subunit (PCNA family)